MKIQLLKDEVINQIAAGEVIERPFSIVRELLDNSIDAGASVVEVSMQSGGQTYISVSDNGCGLEQADALLAFQRHATSKIKNAGDLLSIQTYGFRGEALSSIAAVSKIVFRTRSAEQELGTEICISAGKILSVKPIAASLGTQIEVNNLFFNVPARKKFLKAASTEERKVKDWVKQFALANPKVRFALKINNKIVLQYSPATDLLMRAREVYGEQAVQVSANPLPAVSLLALLAHPDRAQFERSALCIIVNGRVVTDRMLARAVKDAFGSMLKDREFPVGFLSVNLPADMVDVNVHPQKSEVRFRIGRELFAAVLQSVRSALENSTLPQNLASTYGRPNWQTTRSSSDADVEFHSNPGHVADYSNDYSFKIDTAEQLQSMQSSLSFMPGKHKIESTNITPTMESNFQYSSLRYIGQLFKCYLLCEHADQFVIVDMHAAHERVRYNSLRADFRDRTIAAQQLLTPETISLTEAAIERILSEQSMLNQFGFDVESLGEDTLVVRAIPGILGSFDTHNFFKDIASYEDNSDSAGVIERLVDYVAARAACHSSIRSGKIIDQQQAYQLFEQLDKNECNYACPHGRPIVVSFSNSIVEQWFGRTR